MNEATSFNENRPTLRGLRILVLEDEEDTRNLLGIFLETQGAIAILTSNVSQAFESMRSQLFDVIVADIGMPDYNGYAFIAALRKEPRPEIRTIPVIALTAFVTPADRDTALISGFNEYLGKPFEPAELISTIRRLYDDHHKDSAA